MDKRYWHEKLTNEEEKRGYSQGFKLLFCPWDTLGKSRDAFISLNPGEPPAGADLRTPTDERGNSYFVERETTKSPITAQFLKFCELIETPVDDILAGALMPYRTPRWDNKRDSENLDISFEFWTDVLTSFNYQRIFCMGKDVEKAVVKMLAAKLVSEIPAGWGNLTIRKFKSPQGVEVFGLLHFSTFKMMSREVCRSQIIKLLS